MNPQWRAIAYWAAIVALWWATRIVVGRMFAGVWVNAPLAAYTAIVLGVGGFLLGRRVGDHEGALRVLGQWARSTKREDDADPRRY